LAPLDRIKIKIRTSDTFPMTVKCDLILTDEDLFEYKMIEDEQEKKMAELDSLIPKKLERIFMPEAAATILSPHE